MEYKEGDIIKIIDPENIHDHCVSIKPYADFLFKVKRQISPGSKVAVELDTTNIFNRTKLRYNSYQLYNNSTRLATKEDLKEYLDFIFINDNIVFKFEPEQACLISKIINKKYPVIYELGELPTYEYRYFSRKNLFIPTIREEEWLKDGYHIIDIKDLKYMINKIYEKI